MTDTKLDRLQSQLLTSGLQTKDNPLFQVISQLINYLRQFNDNLTGSVTTITNNGANKNADYLTWSAQVVSLPNSRNLLAGVGINFDDSIVNERTISINAATAGFWTPLTDGDPDETDLIFAAGECIMVFVPTP